MFLLTLKVFVKTSKRQLPSPKIDYYLAIWSFTNSVSLGVFRFKEWNFLNARDLGMPCSHLPINVALN